MPTLRCRLIIVGDSTVGKSTIVHQFAELSLPKTYQMVLDALQGAFIDARRRLQSERSKNSRHRLYRGVPHNRHWRKPNLSRLRSTTRIKLCE